MKIKVNGTELFYVVKGEGEPLLMLHGNGEDHTVMEPLALKLSRHFTVYSIDSRGHGQSARTDAISYEDMAADITDFVTVLGLKGASVVGFSDGAIIAILAQLASPGIFSRMVLMGANLSPDDFEPAILEELRQVYEQEGDPLVELMLTEPDIRPEQLGGITVPALVIGAENDIFTRETFVRINAALPDSRLMIIEGHDHGSYILGSDMMYGPVMDFLLPTGWPR